MPSGGVEQVGKSRSGIGEDAVIALEADQDLDAARAVMEGQALGVDVPLAAKRVAAFVTEGGDAGVDHAGRAAGGIGLHHAAVIVLSAGVVGSGLTMWFAVSSLSASLLAWTLLVHNITMLALVLLLIGHIYFTVVYKAIGAMHTGYVSRTAAQLEHSKWVAELDAERAEHEAGGPTT